MSSLVEQISRVGWQLKLVLNVPETRLSLIRPGALGPGNILPRSRQGKWRFRSGDTTSVGVDPKVLFVSVERVLLLVTP
jgi:hypothetical protein